MEKIKYIIHYDINDDEGRTRAPAAVNKAEYIFTALVKAGYDVEIISASLISSKGYFKGSRTNISEKVSLVKLPALKWGNKLQKTVAHVWSRILMFIYLILHTKRTDQVIVYHSLGIMRIIDWARRVRKFTLILETEEIYNDVLKKSNTERNKELRFIRRADKYIFPAQMLNIYLNKYNKPYCIIHGTYRIEPYRNVSFEDGKIHVVYAGTFDPRKGGATAVNAAESLPENYHIHILGFGSKDDTENIKKQIEETNDKARATVTYEGLLLGEEYINFLQKCHIGLSTQNPNADFNSTSFPSKILSYMANGLRVVSVRIPAIEESAIGNDVYYYDEQTPQEIAKAIMAIDFDDNYDGRKKIKWLDEIFTRDLAGLLK